MAPHLLVDISSHGLGHLAQVAPILNQLTCLLPELRLTVRSGLSHERLRARVNGDFAYIQESSDFGFVMLDAVRIDRASTASKGPTSMPLAAGVGRVGDMDAARSSAESAPSKGRQH